MKKWYLIYTKPNQEKIAKLNLENQSLETYLPILVTVDPSEKTVISSKAMFPRYIFSRFDIEEQDYSFIRSTSGVSQVVRFGNKLAEVSDDFISNLKSRSDYDQSFVKEMKIKQYAYGDTVVVSNGLLKGSKGIFIKKSNDRAKILLDILQKKIKVELFFTDLETRLTMDDFKL
tara:strand:+ start:280 stop:801 length:522 start_codon:yes stop_codon:yes gene_type:complete